MRENVPAVAVVFNNQQWGAEKKNQIDYYADRYLGTNLQNPSFAAHRRGDGRQGHQGRPRRTRSATRCSDAVACGRPTVLEVMVTQELGDPFRRDALKKPVRLLEKYRDYTVA